MMEGFNEKILSIEQQEQEEKFLELSRMMSSLSESLDEQQKADDVMDLIDNFKKNCKKNKIDLNKYMFGELIISPNKISEKLTDYIDYDTPNHDIENFITKIFEETTMTPKQIAISKNRQERFNKSLEEAA